jgi:hypothetical protein
MEYIEVMKLPGVHQTFRTQGAMAPMPSGLRPDGSPVAEPVPEVKRRRIWELSGSFHCSIIGTCLTTSELRQLLIKANLLGAENLTDHDLHGRAVLLAGRREPGSKMLQRALDRRHRSAVTEFGRARTTEDLKALWAVAMQRAEIPGAYWAVLTHPRATEKLVRDVFAEVHMLSHLVGAANRADIRRLRELEIENAALQDKATRQQMQLRDAMVARDVTIAKLNDLLVKAIAAQERGSVVEPKELEQPTTSRLIADLEHRLTLEIAKRERAHRRIATLTAECDREKKQRRLLEQREEELRNEVEAAEHYLTSLLPSSSPDQPCQQLTGKTVLYVGGRTHQIAQLREVAEQLRATFLHHDGGIDDRSGLLEAHLARADVTFFPVDCVGHNAIAVVKRISRGMGKHYVALRSCGTTSFMAALRSFACLNEATYYKPQVTP